MADTRLMRYVQGLQYTRRYRGLAPYDVVTVTFDLEEAHMDNEDVKTPGRHTSVEAECRAAVRRLRTTLELAARQNADVHALALTLDGDHAHLTFMPVRLPSPDQPNTQLSAWLARAETFLNC